jgi:hypothetical protein
MNTLNTLSNTEYMVYVWDHNGSEPVLVEKKKFKKFFSAVDYSELMEEKGYEALLLNVAVLTQ